MFASHAPGYKSKALEFQQKVNESMADFECPWRLSDGFFFKVEAEFLDSQERDRGCAAHTEFAELPRCLRARRSAQSQYTARQPRNQDPAPERGPDHERVGVQGDRQRDAVQAFNVELGLAAI